MLGRDFTPPVITLQDVLIRQCSTEHIFSSYCTSKTSGNVLLLRGKKVNNLAGLDSDSKETRKDVLTLKAACILTLYRGQDFQVFHSIFHTCPIFHTRAHIFTVWKGGIVVIF